MVYPMDIYQRNQMGNVISWNHYISLLWFHEIPMFEQFQPFSVQNARNYMKLHSTAPVMSLQQMHRLVDTQHISRITWDQASCWQALMCHRHGPQESPCTEVLNKRFLFVDSNVCQIACCLVLCSARDSIARLASMGCTDKMESQTNPDHVNPRQCVKLLSRSVW